MGQDGYICILSKNEVNSKLIFTIFHQTVKKLPKC
jgi:hypothetical protein